MSSWNEFRKTHRGSGLSMKELGDMYRKEYPSRKKQTPKKKVQRRKIAKKKQPRKKFLERFMSGPAWKVWLKYAPSDDYGYGVGRYPIVGDAKNSDNWYNFGKWIYETYPADANDELNFWLYATPERIADHLYEKRSLYTYKKGKYEIYLRPAPSDIIDGKIKVWSQERIMKERKMETLKIIERYLTQR